MFDWSFDNIVTSIAFSLQNMITKKLEKYNCFKIFKYVKAFQFYGKGLFDLVVSKNTKI